MPEGRVRPIKAKERRAMAAPRTVDDYLAALPEEKRATLEKVRKAIRAAAPKATETISYQIPTYKQDGSLVAFAAFKDHCSFFPMSYKVIQEHQDELKAYDVSKGTIRFPVNKPLPAGLVKKMVKARMKENEARKAR
jgi:uncharacterized protein YdhG (YjbR/CyaY superfamily)